VTRSAQLLALALAFAACLPSEEDGREAMEAALARALPARVPGESTLWPVGRLEVRGHIELRAGEDLWRVEVSRTADVREDGAMRLLDVRRVEVRERTGTPEARIDTREDRFEAILAEDVWVTRRGHGPWIARDTTDGLPRRTLARVRDWLPTLVRAFGGQVGLVPTAGAVEVFGGRPGVWRRLVLEPRVGGPSPDAAVLAALRDDEDTWPAWADATFTVDAVEGVLAVAADSADEVLAGEMTARGGVRIGEAPGRFEARAEHRISNLPPAADFSLPAQMLPEARERPWSMIRRVLGDALTETWGGPAPALR
jgi:hypothetical protein